MSFWDTGFGVLCGAILYIVIIAGGGCLLARCWEEPSESEPAFAVEPAPAPAEECRSWLL